MAALIRLLIAAILIHAAPAEAWMQRQSGTAYFLSPTGSDVNNGLTIAAPWLTPNHAVNCGDVIIAASGTYSSANFQNAKWGTVSSCPSGSGIYFAQIICAIAFTCSIADTTSNGLVVDASNWVVFGWNLSSTLGACFAARPSGSANIHHIAFINNVANGCQQNGFTSFTNIVGNPQFGVDYFAVVGAIAYNAAQGSLNCYSGISVYEPANVDTAPGTHIFIAGAFSIANIDPTNCASGANSDGEGIIFDNWSHSQQTGSAYTGQGVIEQSLAVGNGSNGVLVFQNTAAPVFVASTTTWGNMQNPTKTGTFLGEMLLNGSTSANSVTNSLFQATVASVSGGTVFACYVGLGNGSNVVTNDYCFGVAGSNTQINSSTGFSFGTITTVTPNFVNPAVPGAPNCSGFANTTACMTTVRANFVAQAVGATGLGYQSPGACTADALYPVWLKGVVPNGIITKPCGL